MSALAIGASITLTVGDGGFITIATAGGLAVASIAPSASVASVVNLGPLAERRRFGIFTEGAQVTVTNVSCAGFDYDYSGSGLTQDQVIAVQALVSANRIQDTISRVITAADNGRLLAPTTALTYTIPAGLSPAPSFSLDSPAAGAVTIAVSGGATINGAATSLSRTRISNLVGFVVVAHNDTDAYGVSGV